MKPGNGVSEGLQYRECLRGGKDLKTLETQNERESCFYPNSTQMSELAFTLSKASEVDASIDVDEAAKKRGWGRALPGNGEETDGAAVQDDIVGKTGGEEECRFV